MASPPTRGKRFRFKQPHLTPKPPTTKPAPPLSSSSPPHASQALDTDPEPTFAQSLFASLSSPSAASFWADIYGQPIHIYPRPIVSGHLLSDNEYVAYVQQRVWENTQEGLAELARERARERERERECERQQAQEKQRRQRKRKRQEKEEERDVLDAAKEQQNTIWQEKTKEYIAAWEAGNQIPWPCGREQVDVESVAEFLQRVARGMGVGFEQVVKVERVRWHPDKILQRFGDEAARDEGMERVNEVWRAIDSIWRRIKD